MKKGNVNTDVFKWSTAKLISVFYLLQILLYLIFLSLLVIFQNTIFYIVLGGILFGIGVLMIIKHDDIGVGMYETNRRVLTWFWTWILIYKHGKIEKSFQSGFLSNEFAEKWAFFAGLTFIVVSIILILSLIKNL